MRRSHLEKGGRIMVKGIRITTQSLRVTNWNSLSLRSQNYHGMTTGTNSSTSL